MISIVLQNTFFIKVQKKGNQKPFTQSYHACKNDIIRNCQTKCEQNQKAIPPPKKQGQKIYDNFLQENDTSGWDCIHMSSIDRVKRATSLQVLYEDLQTYQDDINTYKDWMIILERLEAMQNLNTSLFYQCITEFWIPIGYNLIESLSNEEVYIVIEKLSALHQDWRNDKYQYTSFVFSLLKEKLEINDIISWTYNFDRLTKIEQINKNFWRQLVVAHFLPKAEKLIQAGYISQIQFFLYKISSLKLKINEQNVKSFVKKICRQKVLRYTYDKLDYVQMYIDMMSIVGDILEDGSLSENHAIQTYQQSSGNQLGKEDLKDILPFFISCYSVIVMNLQEIKNTEQLEKICKVRSKFGARDNLPQEVKQCYAQLSKLKLAGISDQQLQDVVRQYRLQDIYV